MVKTTARAFPVVDKREMPCSFLPSALPPFLKMVTTRASLSCAGIVSFPYFEKQGMGVFKEIRATFP